MDLILNTVNPKRVILTCIFSCTIIFISFPALGQEQGQLQGTVVDAATGTPLVGATVLVEGADVGTTTDSTGGYDIQLPAGTYSVVFDFVGYRQVTRTAEVTPQATVDVELEPVRVSLNEIVVVSRTQGDRTQSVNTGITRLDAANLERLPTFMGSPDIVRGLLAKPGVSSVSEGAAGFNVRGGNVGQNLILLEDTPVYFPSHLLGLFDPFNADAIADVTLHKSSIPAQYGGRISSVLRLDQKVGRRESFHLRGGASPITSRLFVEGPIVKEKTSFVIGGRGSYVNWLLNSTGNSDLENSRAFFYDINFGVNNRFNSANEMDVTGYRAFDKFVLADTTFRYETSNASIAWNHLFNDQLFMDITGVIGNYSFSVRDSEPENAFIIDSNIRTFELKGDMTWNPGNQHTLGFGISTKYYDINPGNIRPGGAESEISSLQVENEYGLESAVYVSDKMTVTDRFAVEAGLRVSMFGRYGPAQTLVFENGMPREPETITDTITTRGGEAVETYVGIAPRLSVRYSLSQTSSVKFSYDRTLQYLHLLSNSTALAPTDVWHLSDRYRKPQIGDQVSGGYFQNFRGGSISSSAEIFYKWIQNPPAFKPGAEPLLNTSLSTDLLSGAGRAYGIEVQAEKSEGRYTGRVGYTYSRTFRRVTGETPPERVNEGKWYPASHDRPHELTARFTYTGEDPRAQWNFKFTYRSGRAITFPSSKFVVDGIPVANVSGRNQERVPAYHRLDLSLRLDLERREKRGWNGSWTFSVYNVYGRRNVSSIFFGRDHNGAPQAYSRSVLGTVFPSLTYTFEY